MALGLQGGIALGTATLGAVTGLFQRAKANRLERANVRPTATVNSNLLKNQAITSMMANQGMSQAQYNNVLAQQQLGLASGLRASGLYGRNGFNANSVLRGYGNQVNQLNIADENIRTQNLGRALGANSAVAQDEQRVWNWNKAQPYQQTAQRVASLRGQGNANIIGGIGSVAQAGLMGAFGGNNLFGTNDNVSTTTQSPIKAPLTLGGLRGWGVGQGLYNR